MQTTSRYQPSFANSSEEEKNVESTKKLLSMDEKDEKNIDKKHFSKLELIYKCVMY